MCPSREGGFPTEIPFPSFQVAVFENRFPSFVEEAPPPPEGLPVPAGRALGRCEVVVYTPAHTGSLATLTEEERLLLAWAWRDRYEALYALPGVRFVMPFENRGEAVGVTLHHPHGQIYAYPFVPPVLERESQAFRERPVLLRLFPSLGPYVVDEEEGFLAFVPPSPATPLRSGWPPWKGTPVPGPSPRGRWRPSPGSWAGWWPGTTPSLGSPSLTSWSSTPRPWGGGHLSLPRGVLPPRRTRDKLKFLAGTELGAGTFVVDALPEETAKALRAALP